MNRIVAPLLAFALAVTPVARAEDRTSPPPADPDLSALQKQNAMMEEKIKLLTQQQQLENLKFPDPLTRQNEILTQRMKLMSQEKSLRSMASRSDPKPADAPFDRFDHKDDTVENIRLAYTSLPGIAPEVAKALACGGKNIVLYGPAQSESLLSVPTFNDQVELLRTRLKSVLDIQAPSGPERETASSGVFGVAALSGPVLQSVLDLISFLHTNSSAGGAEVPVDESGLVAVIANAATAQGCLARSVRLESLQSGLASARQPAGSGRSKRQRRGGR